MIAVALAAAALQLMPFAAPEQCASICDARRLKPYFDKLARIERDGRTVRILQLGDSHTAGDQITGAWRQALQARYGNAGRGILAPGRPYQGYLTRDVTAQASGPWAIAGIFGPAYSSASTTPIGLSNYSLTGAPGASLSLRADRVAFDRLTVCALTGPAAGTLTLTAGGAARVVPLAAASVAVRCETLDAPGATLAGVAVAGAPVTVTSWATERGGPGVILSNLGTVGAQLVHLTRGDDRVAAAEAALYRPDLLVVAFGTNEAFIPGFKAGEYASRLRVGIDRLQRLFPGVPMLMLGAPDSGTARPELQRGESGTSAPCGSGLGLGTDGAVQDWRPTAALAAVQAVQRRIAHDEGIAFWDWSKAMGGRCTASAWTRATLMRPDHVHFTTTGAAEIAKRLQADLDAAAFEVGAR